MNAKYISVTETAKLVRIALKKAFPTIKFSVRSSSYSGGASIDVRWTDGATTKEVETIAKQFAGATFDGMIDLKSHHDSVNEQGETVQYGADYVFCTREYSREFMQTVLDYVCFNYGVVKPELNSWNWVDDQYRIIVNNGSYPHDTLGDHLNRVRYATSEANLSKLIHEMNNRVPLKEGEARIIEDVPFDEPFISEDPNDIIVLPTFPKNILAFTPIEISASFPFAPDLAGWEMMCYAAQADAKIAALQVLAHAASAAIGNNTSPDLQAWKLILGNL